MAAEPAAPPAPPSAPEPPALEFTTVGFIPAPAQRLLPRRSLRSRFLFSIVALVGFVLAALALVFVLTSRSALRRDIEQRAQSYAALATGPICEAYETYYSSGYSKFRELVTDISRRNPDLVGLSIYDTSGKLLFGDAELQKQLFQPGEQPSTFVREPRLLAAVKGLETMSWQQVGERGETFRVVVPYVEEWGRHRYSVVFDISYHSLRAAIRDLGVRLLWLTAASLLLGTVIAFLLARQILRPLSALTEGAADLAEGRLDRRIDVRTRDELGVLSNTFNHMAARLATSINDLEAGNRALQQTNVELRELDRMKSDLLANVSHELRTPLTSVKGYNEALAEELLGPINDAQREAIEVSARNLERLLHMINELLSYARFESGAVQVERRPTDLAAIGAQVVEGLIAARGPEINVHLIVEGGLPLADADGPKIAQVMENLLTNAVKFTPTGGRIEVRLRRDGDEVLVEVADSGIGIPRDQQQRIFERFYQIESSSTRKYGGIGLGLAIVRQILDAHGAAIQVESEPGRGATFRFHLPVAEHLTATGTRGPRVVVVDDDVPFARALAEELEGAGYHVRIAGSFQGAERLVRELRPRAVVLDRLLPDGDGFDLIARWRQQLDDKHLPIVVVSVRQEEALARRLGANASLTKPVPAARVREELETVLAGIRAPTVLALPLAGGGELFERMALLITGSGLRLHRLASARELEEQVGRKVGAAAVITVGPGIAYEAAVEVRHALGLARVPTVIIGMGAAELEPWKRELRVVGVASSEQEVDVVASLLRDAVSSQLNASSP